MTDTQQQMGQVIEVKSLLVVARGLGQVPSQGWVRFENGAWGQILFFDADTVTIVNLSQIPVQIGSSVQLVKETPEIEVSMHLLGKCIDPLGKEIATDFTKGRRVTATRKLAEALANEEPARYMPLDPSSPHLANRRTISSNLQTGVGIVDLLVPIAKGQRELIVGDQKTGKTTFLYQTILSQAKQGTVIVWASIGKKSTEIKQLLDFIHEHDIAEHVITVATTPQDPDSLIYLTPFAAMSVAEYFRDLGQDVLVIMDDLSTHAKFYREISLLAKKFPGRDSYPGDIFYTHAHLLERAGVFMHPSYAKEYIDKSVSITVLPVANSSDSDLTSYIVSNLISITDGHILFDTTLFSRGNRPAINTGLSVTRIGRQSQTALVRSVSREVSSFLAAYSKLVSLTHFGAELSDESTAQLQLGERLIVLFRQPSASNIPLPVLLIMIGGLWLKWWQDTTPEDILHLRDTLINQYANEALKIEISDLLEANTMEVFLEILTKYKSALSTVTKNK